MPDPRWILPHVLSVCTEYFSLYIPRIIVADTISTLTMTIRDTVYEGEYLGSSTVVSKKKQLWATGRNEIDESVERRSRGLFVITRESEYCTGHRVKGTANVSRVKVFT